MDSLNEVAFKCRKIGDTGIADGGKRRVGERREGERERWPESGKANIGVVN